jgi:pimeloyl-ACP methyl ester carboxylesterase
VKFGVSEVRGAKASFLMGRSGIKPGRPNLLLVHGAGGSSMSWLTQLNGLDGDMNVVAVDMPGHGETPGGPFDKVELYAAWVTEFMETAGITPCFLLGHSLGGAVAQRIALDSPRLLSGVIISGSGARLRVTPKILDHIMDDFTATVRFVVESCYTRDAPTDLIRQALKLARQVPAATFYANFIACNHFDVTGEIQHLSLPTLIIVGREDVMTPVKYSEYLHTAIKGSKLVILENGGHCVMHQAIAEYNDAVKEFILDVSDRYSKGSKIGGDGGVHFGTSRR